MTNTPVMNAEEKNQHLGRMAFCALVALKLAQADGKTGCSLQAENIFLVRWLQTALKQKRFHRCVAGDLVWLSGHGRQHPVTAELRRRLEFLWRSCCCEVQAQTPLFRLTYATEQLKDAGWDSVVSDKTGWEKITAASLIPGAVPAFYVLRSALESGFDESGQLAGCVDFLVAGDHAEFESVMTQYHLYGCFLPESRLFRLGSARK